MDENKILMENPKKIEELIFEDVVNKNKWFLVISDYRAITRIGRILYAFLQHVFKQIELPKDRTYVVVLENDLKVAVQVKEVEIANFAELSLMMRLQSCLCQHFDPAEVDQVFMLMCSDKKIGNLRTPQFEDECRRQGITIIEDTFEPIVLDTEEEINNLILNTTGNKDKRKWQKKLKIVKS